MNVSERDQSAEAEVGRAALIGEPSAADFDRFYREQYKAVVGLAYALTGSRTAAEELAQDAFTTTYRKWSSVSGYDNPEGWVRQVVANASRSWGRRKGAELRALTKIGGRRQPLVELIEPANDFWAAVRSLPTRQSQVVALHYLEDRPVDEIAAILDLGPGTVKKHLHRGRAALARKLEHPIETDDFDPTEGSMP